LLDPNYTPSALKTLTRLAQRRPETEPYLRKALRIELGAPLVDTAVDVAIATGDPIEHLLAQTVDQWPAELVECVLEHLDEGKYWRSIPLLELMVNLTSTRLEILRRHKNRPTKSVLSEAARLTFNLGTRLYALGRSDEILPIARRAVQLYRKLASRSPGEFLPMLARSLASLGLYLSDLGRDRDALRPAREAVELFRQLTQKLPDELLVSLADSLSNLSICLSRLGRIEQAIETVLESIGILRGFSSSTRNAILPLLAACLNNMGGWLHKLDRIEDCLVVLPVTKMRRNLDHLVALSRRGRV
jgi:tetratricopeptide (TPR) repeat protein